MTAFALRQLMCQGSAPLLLTVSRSFRLHAKAVLDKSPYTN